MLAMAPCHEQIWAFSEWRSQNIWIIVFHLSIGSGAMKDPPTLPRALRCLFRCQDKEENGGFSSYLFQWRDEFMAALGIKILQQLYDVAPNL